VELKAKQNLSPQDLKPLLALAEEKKLKRYLCVSFEPRPRKLAGMTMPPSGSSWTDFGAANMHSRIDNERLCGCCACL
jgi:hypothetical protein